jgi:nitroreductase
MNDIIQFLQQRNSAPKLTAPAPSLAERESIFSAAMRAPDHARLRPWRFISVDEDRRQALGVLFRDALLARNPQADESALEKAEKSPLRAHPKVPPIEQKLSAGCAAHGVLLAAQALGYAGVWRTGDAAFDRNVMDGLGLANNEEITGFLYLGTREGDPKPLPSLATTDFVSQW